MNRAERRRKVTFGAGRTKAEMAMHQRLAVVRASNEAMTPAMIADLMLPTYEALTNMMEGRGEDADFRRLWKGVTFGLLLARRLDAYSNEKEQFKALGMTFTLACTALEHIEKRRTSTGRYGVAGVEIKDMRAALLAVDEMLALTSRGHGIEAMLMADQDAAKKFGYRPAVPQA